MDQCLIEAEEDLVNFFTENIDDTEPIEILLVRMLNLLQEMLKLANAQ